MQQDPWEDHINEYKVGQLVEGTITRLVKFGAFARLDEHIEGLIHISELSEDRIEHPKEVVSEDDELVLRIIKIEPERRRIGLSLRKVDSAAYSDMDWEMTLAEIDDIDEAVPEEDPGAELKEALDLADQGGADEPASSEDTGASDSAAESIDEDVKESEEPPVTQMEETPPSEGPETPENNMAESSVESEEAAEPPEKGEMAIEESVAEKGANEEPTEAKGDTTSEDE